MKVLSLHEFFILVNNSEFWTMDQSRKAWSQIGIWFDCVVGSDPGLMQTIGHVESEQRTEENAKVFIGNNIF